MKSLFKVSGFGKITAILSRRRQGNREREHKSRAASSKLPIVTIPVEQEETKTDHPSG